MLIMKHPDPNMSLALRVIPMPQDANLAGNVFGGYVMGHIDLAATCIAYGVTGGLVATRAVDSMAFKKPVHLRDILNFWGKVTNIGTTSIQINIEVYAQRMGEPEPIKVTEANLTFVAVDEKGRPRKIAEAQPEELLPA